MFSRCSNNYPRDISSREMLLSRFGAISTITPPPPFLKGPAFSLTPLLTLWGPRNQTANSGNASLFFEAIERWVGVPAIWSKRLLKKLFQAYPLSFARNALLKQVQIFRSHIPISSFAFI
jgi:hypothetical protein